MSDALAVDLFVEDRAHEDFLRPLLHRLATQVGRPIEVRTRAARGGHARAITELHAYQTVVVKGGLPSFDLLVVAVDANCKGLNQARRSVRDGVVPEFRDRAIVACPDPHIERWYLADPISFQQVVGARPKLQRRKCERALYKDVLARTVREAGHPLTLGGIEFAAELVAAMDLYRAGKAEPSLRHLLSTATAKLKQPWSIAPG